MLEILDRKYIGQWPQLWLIAVAVVAGLWLRGFDSTAGQASACIINCLLLIALQMRAGDDPAFWRRAAPVLALAVAAIAWACIASNAQDGALPDYFGGKLLSLVAGLAALLAGASIGPRQDQRLVLLDRMTMLVCLSLFVGLLVRAAQFSGVEGGWPMDRQGRFVGLVGNSNITAAIAGAFTIYTVVRLLLHVETHGAKKHAAGAWKDEVLVRTAIRLTMFALCFGVSLLTASRTINLLLLIALLAIGFWWFRAIMRDRMHTWLLPAIVGLAGLFILLLLTGVLVQRYLSLGRGGADRMDMWMHYWSVAWASPVFGYGLGSFPFINTETLATPRMAGALWAVNSPHSIVLQLLIGGGLPYLLLLAAAALAMIVQIVGRLRGRWRVDDLAIVMMIVMMFAGGLVDILLDVPASVTVFLFLAGLLWGRALRLVAPDVEPVRGEKLDHEVAVGV